MAWIGAAIAGGVALVGDSMASSGQSAANAMNQQEILQEEQWETNMSNTAMQRRVQDLNAAGLNPMLAIQQGGASTPGIGTIAAQNPNQAYGQLGQQASSAVQTYLQAKQTNAQVDQAEAAAGKARADAAMTVAQTPYSAEQSKANVAVLQNQAAVLWQQMANLGRDFDIKNTNFAMLQNDAAFQKQFLQLKQQMMSYDVQAQKAGLPPLQADAAFARAHPEVWALLSSGAPQGVGSVVNSATSLIPGVNTLKGLRGFFK